MPGEDGGMVRQTDLDPQFHAAALTGLGCAHYLKELERENLALHQDDSEICLFRAMALKCLGKGVRNPGDGWV